jgi:hypothetical protein
MAQHDRRQHAWFVGFLDRLFGAAAARAAAAG